MRYAAVALEVAPISRFFAALGDDVRLRMVALLTHGELCVCHIEEALELKQANASRHLGILRATRIVHSERRDRWVYYSLAPQIDPDCQQHLKTLIASFSKEKVLRKDVARLLESRGKNPCK